MEEELNAELRLATNPLWQQLHRYYPQMLSLNLLSEAPLRLKERKFTLLDQQLRDVSRRIGNILAALAKSNAEDGASPS